MDAVMIIVSATLISVIVIASLIPLSKKLGWLDRPDARKQHIEPTPPIGGFGILASVLFPILFLSGFNQMALGYSIGAILLVFIGALDDRFDINWRIRILVHVVAALAMIYISGVRVEHFGALFGFGDIELGWVSVPFTIFATVGLVNALNMFDGVDGLVGAVCSAVVCMFIAAAYYAGADQLAEQLLWVLGAIVGFLLFNMHYLWQDKAKVFLGDAGSGLIGFTIAFIMFRLTQNPGHPISPVLGPYLLAPPVIDCLVLIAHRLRQGRSPFAAGRDHGHHLMLEAGFRAREIARFMVLLSCVIGLFGALALYANVPEPILVMVYMFMLFTWFWITTDRQRAIRYFIWVHNIMYAPIALKVR
jgi:UDP-GlcNAc:undecaprenyl-phosphate GlcNAc-1-phosphate transferase